jgi:hypothetical protein
MIHVFRDNHDELETKKKPAARKGKAPGSSKKQPTTLEKSENEETSVNDELKLSEEDEPTDDKMKSATSKKGPTKRSAPTSGKKPAATIVGKKKGQVDEPFEDRTNGDNHDEPDNNSDDGLLLHAFVRKRSTLSLMLILEATAAKQVKKGRSAEKASASTTKSTARTAKKTKAT